MSVSASASLATRSLAAARAGSARRRAGALLLAAALVSAAAPGREIPFTMPPAVATGVDAPYAVAAGDVDGDGRVDLVVASRFADTVAWYRLGGDGVTWSAETIFATADGANAVAVADFDGDGDLDVVSSQPGATRITWHENADGVGGSWTTILIDNSIFTSQSVEAADLDGDGDADVLATSLSGNAVIWYENDGLGGGWTLNPVTGTATQATSATAADLDRDGDLDIVTTSQGNDTVAWHRNDGGGIAFTAFEIDATADLARAAAIADLDRDGDLDVLAAAYGENSVTWYENDGDPDDEAPELWAAHPITTTANGPHDLGVADLDGDGDPDVSLADFAGNDVIWIDNGDGAGGAWTARTVDAAANGVTTVATADLDGDGDLDLAATADFDDEILWYRNDTVHRSAVFTSGTTISSAADFAESVVSADLDRDGDLDLVSASLNDSEVAWYRNPAVGGGAWTEFVITSSAGAARWVDIADVDRDGDLDVVAAGQGGNKVSWYANRLATGQSWVETAIPSITGARAVAAGDVDGDGDADFVSTARGGDAILFHRNLNGLGTSWSTQPIESPIEGPLSVALGDIDGDGDLDVVSGVIGDEGNATDDRIAWHRNVGGAGNSWQLVTVDTDAFDPASVAAIDVDRDGRLDIAFATRAAPEIGWFRNADGAGTSWTHHVASTAGSGFYGIGSGDLDGDGDLDLLGALINDDQIRWYENSGDGTSWGPRTISANEQGAAWVHAADLDRDGDLDVVSASRDDDRIAWFENRGGQFAIAAVSTAPAEIAETDADDVLRVDFLHLGRGGDSEIELATLELLFDDGTGAVGANPLSSSQVNALVERLELWVDEDDGVFDPMADTFYGLVSPLDLTGGVLDIVFADGDPLLAVAAGGVRTYFVVLEADANAGGQTPGALRVTHLASAGSSAEDRAADLLLVREGGADSGTGSIAFPETADLSVTKTDGVTTATPGNTLVYTIVAANAGPSAADDAVVSDDFPAILDCDWICSGAGGATCPASGSGDFQATVDLPANGSVTFTATCLVSASATGTVTNTATVEAPAGFLDPVATNDSATDIDTLAPSADLRMTKTDNVTTAVPGGSVIYTVRAINDGPSDAPGATVIDDFPATLDCDWTCSGTDGGSCGTASGSGDIDETVTLPAESHVTFTATCAIAASATGTLVNSATATAPDGVADPTPGNDTASDTDTLTPTADLSVTKTDGVAIEVPGTTVTYTIVAANAGPSDAPDSQVSDDFPAILSSCAWTCSGTNGGTCSANGVGDLADTADLPAGGSVTYAATCTIASTATGSLVNTATVAPAAGVSDPVPANGTATDTDTLEPRANLAITNSNGVSVVEPGDLLTYTIVASNPGPSHAPSNQVLDGFEPDLTCAWTCAAAGGATCTASGDGGISDIVPLPVGSSVTYTANCAVSLTPDEWIYNEARVLIGGGVTEIDTDDNEAIDEDPTTVIFEDGFESGDTEEWSAAVPLAGE